MIQIRVNSKSIYKVAKEGVYYIKHKYGYLSICVFEDHSLQQLCINRVSKGAIILKYVRYNYRCGLNINYIILTALHKYLLTLANLLHTL